MKRRFTLCLVFALCLTVLMPAFPVSADESGICGSSLTWRFEKEVLTISGTGKMYTYDRFELPPWGHVRTEVKKLVIESGVTAITENAFEGFTALTEVSIADTVTTIEGRAFLFCSSLKEVVIPNGVTTIGDFCFSGCTALEKVHIAASVTTIDMDAFHNCTALKEIYFRGDAGYRMHYAFTGVVATAYYPEDNDTWTEDVRKSYGETITWVAKKCMNGHTAVVDPGKEPTCTEAGLTEGRHCSVCGEVLVAQEPAPATGHTEAVDKAKAPTCTETGLTEGRHCHVCGEVLVAQETVPARGHTMGDWNVVQEATEEKEGSEERSCSECDFVEERKTERLTPSEPKESDEAGTSQPGSAGGEDDPSGELWIVIAVLAVLAVGGAVAFLILKRKK
jgi:hypothetical protein